MKELKEIIDFYIRRSASSKVKELVGKHGEMTVHFSFSRVLIALVILGDEKKRQRIGKETKIILCVEEWLRSCPELSEILCLESGEIFYREGVPASYIQEIYMYAKDHAKRFKHVKPQAGKSRGTDYKRLTKELADLEDRLVMVKIRRDQMARLAPIGENGQHHLDDDALGKAEVGRIMERDEKEVTDLKRQMTKKKAELERLKKRVRKTRIYYKRIKG